MQVNIKLPGTVTKRLLELQVKSGVKDTREVVTEALAVWEAIVNTVTDKIGHGDRPRLVIMDKSYYDNLTYQVPDSGTVMVQLPDRLTKDVDDETGH